MQIQSLSALDLRCRMALARALWVVDRVTSTRIASETIRHLVQAIHGGADPECPAAWPIKTDPVLSFAYQEGMRLLERRNALCKQLEIARANAALREGSRMLAMKQRLLEEPSAQTLLQQLQMRIVVELNQHTLSYDTVFRCLSGTNPYGIDYYAGNMTLECVDQWRTAMIKGQTWGASPVPEWDDVGEPMENREVRKLQNAIEWIDDEFSALANMQTISFAPGHSGLVDARTGKPFPEVH